MNSILRFFVTCLIASLCLPAAFAADNDRIVVMISVDGLAGSYMDDPKAEMPTIRQIAAEGARAESMKAVSPSVTWPNHTTLVTGVFPAKHGVVGNNYLDRETLKNVVLLSDPQFDKDQIVKVPTIYDLAKEHGLKTLGVLWPASRNAKTLDWTSPDVASQELYEKYSTPQLLSEAKEAGIHVEQQGDWHKAGEYDKKDNCNTQVFNLMLQKHRPNLALLHLVDVDHIEHINGPQTPQAYAAIKGADANVRAVWDELKKDFPGKATLIIVSDHGFVPIEHAILSNIILRNAGLVEITKTRVTGGIVRTVTQGGCGMIYILDPANRDAIAAKVAAAFKDIEGVSKIIMPDQLKDYGVGDSKADPHAPDMILFAKSGYTFGDTTGGELPVVAKSPERKGTHGHDPSMPQLRATFAAWGVGIKPGTKFGEIQNTDVAPTIAKLLGFEMPNVDGKPIDAALSIQTAAGDR
jgi:predicted AlkP superfamily pyrophosphatase or phosphodiesterase